MRKRHRITRFPVLLLCLLCIVACGCGSLNRGVEINPADARIDARATLLQMADDSDPQVRSNAMEAMAAVMPSDRQATGRILQSLGDENPWIQFAAAMAAGDMMLTEAKPTLLEMARKQGPDKRVYCAVIYALYALGDSSHASDLVKLLRHREPEVRANAAMVIGRMGEPSGIDLLKSRLHDEEQLAQWNVVVNMYEAMASLGDSPGAMRLERFIRERDLQIRLAAIEAYPRCAPDRARIVLLDMIDSSQPPRIRVAAAGSLAKLGQVYSSTYQLCIKAARRPESFVSEVPVGTGEDDKMQAMILQRLAAIALGYMGRVDAVEVLRGLLESPYKPVRVAAAMSIMRLLPQQGQDRPSAGPTQPQPQPEELQGDPKPELQSAGAKE